MDTSNSPLIAPVCARLKSLFEITASDPVPVDLGRLLEALDDAYARGELFSSQHPFPSTARQS